MNSTKQPTEEKNDKATTAKALKTIDRLYLVVLLLFLATFASTLFGATSILGLSIEIVYNVWSVCVALLFITKFVVSSSISALILGVLFSYISINAILDLIAK